MKKTNVRLYVTQPLGKGANVRLGKEETHYLKNVMRLGPGDAILLFNGSDGEWGARIEDAGKKSIRLVCGAQTRPQESGPDLWLVFAPIKKTRIDFVAEKATELGVSRLMPARTERTVVSRVKTGRLLANAKEAAEQCERLTLPQVGEMKPLKKILETWPAERNLLFCDEEKNDPPIERALKQADTKPARKPWAILIGPEGGFSEKERELIRGQKFCIPAALGPRVLRADTAAFAAISLWQSIIGDW